MTGASQVALVIKNPPANAGDIRDPVFISALGRFPGEGHGNSLQYSCLELSHGQRSLAGYSPWGCKELHKTEVTEHASMQQGTKWAPTLPLHNLVGNRDKNYEIIW